MSMEDAIYCFQILGYTLLAAVALGAFLYWWAER